jgi:transposase
VPPGRRPQTLDEALDALDAAWVLIATLQARVEELERLLKQSSLNSSRPPSSDPPSIKHPPKKPPSGRKPGGQPGHDGSARTLLPPEKVDKTTDHWAERCRQCELPFPADPAARVEVGEPERHQIVEVPKPKPYVEEHRLHALACTCGCVTRADLPAGIPTGAFGPRLTGVIAVLSGGYRLSKRAIQGLLRELFGVEISLGSITACEQSMSETLAPAVDEARAFVKQQPVAHADETGWREGRRRAWLWVAVTTSVTVFLIDRRRNAEAALALLGQFAGILVSDRWKAYDFIDLVRRQFCWSHLRRDFQWISEHRGKAAKIGAALLAASDQMFHWWHRIRDGTMTRVEFREAMKPLREQVEELIREGGTCRQRKVAGMCWQLYLSSNALWTFVDVEGVEPTNNAGEQKIRPAVMYRKTSFGTHSEAGSRFVERMLTVVATLRQQKRDVMDYVTHASEAALRGERPASLLPTPAPTTLPMAA